MLRFSLFFFFFFNDTATTEIYTLSLHDALPIYRIVYDTYTSAGGQGLFKWYPTYEPGKGFPGNTCISVNDEVDRKSTRLNSSHDQISYAVFCLKKKKKKVRFQQSVIRMQP